MDAELARRQNPEAEAAKIGDYFEYNLKEKITIGKNQSALVPILQSALEAEKVTLWSSVQGSSQVPLRAVWLKNTSGQILDSGTFNIIDNGTFAGEGVLESVHPDERRLLSYAADTAVHVKREDEYSDKPYSRVKVAKGLMILTRALWSSKCRSKQVGTSPKRLPSQKRARVRFTGSGSRLRAERPPN
jgi:hypothetical protein